MEDEIVITKKTRLKVFSKEDFERVILVDDGKNFFDKRAEIERDLGIEIPEDLSSLEDIVEYAFNIYQKTLEDFELNKLKVVRFKSNKKNVGVSKKDWIINWIDEHSKPQGFINYKELEKDTDAFFGYSAQGKNPRTRIRNVLKELIRKGLVKEDKSKGIVYVTNNLN